MHLGSLNKLKMKLKTPLKCSFSGCNKLEKVKKCPRNSASGNPQNFQRFVLKVMEAKS
jgi:hypothetical protein